MAKSDSPTRIRVADLPAGRALPFSLVPDPVTLGALAAELRLNALRKVRFEGRLEPVGRGDWRLVAELGATMVQPCVVTLMPVTTRVEEAVERHYLADPPPVQAGEAEMPEDEAAEALPEAIDLEAVLAEALALAVPAYPRAEGAALEETRFAEPGVAPMSDEEAKPFAGLAALKDKLGGDEE